MNISTKELRKAVLEFDLARAKCGRDYVQGTITEDEADRAFGSDVNGLLSLIESAIQEARKDEVKHLQSEVTNATKTRFFTSSGDTGWETAPEVLARRLASLTNSDTKTDKEVSSVPE